MTQIYFFNIPAGVNGALLTLQSSTYISHGLWLTDESVTHLAWSVLLSSLPSTDGLVVKVINTLEMGIEK